MSPMLPPNYQSTAEAKAERESKYIDPSKIQFGNTLTVRPCGTYVSGHVIAGWSYFSTVHRKTVRFPEFPENYLDDIGLSYEGRTKGTGEKDTPNYFLAMVVLCKETDSFAVLEIPQVSLREKVERVYAIDDYEYDNDAIAPFYLTVSRDKNEKGKTVYDAIPTLKPAGDDAIARWKEAKDGIWLPALFDGADPFKGRPAEERAARPARKSKGQPPVATDSLGAEVEGDAKAAPTAW